MKDFAKKDFLAEQDVVKPRAMLPGDEVKRLEIALSIAQSKRDEADRSVNLIKGRLEFLKLALHRPVEAI